MLEVTLGPRSENARGCDGIDGTGENRFEQRTLRRGRTPKGGGEAKRCFRISVAGEQGAGLGQQTGIGLGGHQRQQRHAHLVEGQIEATLHTTPAHLGIGIGEHDGQMLDCFVDVEAGQSANSHAPDARIGRAQKFRQSRGQCLWTKLDQHFECGQTDAEVMRKQGTGQHVDLCVGPMTAESPEQSGPHGRVGFVGKP